MQQRVVVVGVEPELADDAPRSLETGVRQSLGGQPATMADGVRTVSIGERPFEVIVSRKLVNEIVPVSEADLAAAMVMAWEQFKLAIEPSGALPVAAYLAGKLEPALAEGPTALSW